jgi:hypothetical protein
MRPSDIQLILSYNSFHLNLQFTVDEFSDSDITSMPLELLSIESPFILLNTPTYQASHPGEEKLLGSELSLIVPTKFAVMPLS